MRRQRKRSLAILCVVKVVEQHTVISTHFTLQFFVEKAQQLIKQFNLSDKILVRACVFDV